MNSHLPKPSCPRVKLIVLIFYLPRLLIKLIFFSFLFSISIFYISKYICLSVSQGVGQAGVGVRKTALSSAASGRSETRLYHLNFLSSSRLLFVLLAETHVWAGKLCCKKKSFTCLIYNCLLDIESIRNRHKTRRSLIMCHSSASSSFSVDQIVLVVVLCFLVSPHSSHCSPLFGLLYNYRSNMC